MLNSHVSNWQASLRAAVFTCVDEHERVAGVHVHNPSALRVKHDPAGALENGWTKAS